MVTWQTVLTRQTEVEFNIQARNFPLCTRDSHIEMACHRLSQSLTKLNEVFGGELHDLVILLKAET